MNNKTILVLFILCVGVIAFTEDAPKPDKVYAYKCHTDMECQIEEEKCLASGECK